MPRLLCLLLLGVAVVLVNLRGTHSSAIDSNAEGELNAKTIANQTADVQPSKVRQVEDVVLTNRRQTLPGVIDDETTHLFFGEANPIANDGNVRTFSADAFGTLLVPTNQEVNPENPADAPVLIHDINGRVQKIQAGEVNVPVLEIHSRSGAENPIGDSSIVDNVSESFAESPLDSTVHQIGQVQDGATAEAIAISKSDESAHQRVAQIDRATHIGQSDSSVTESGTRQLATSQVTHVQEMEIEFGDHSSPFSSNSGEPQTFQMEHQGDFAVELNPNTNERVNMRSQMATNVSGRDRHMPMVKVKHIFNIHVQPLAPFRALPRALWKQEDSSMEFLLNDQAPVQLLTGQSQAESQVPSGLARTDESNLGNVDSFVPDDIAGPAQVQPDRVSTDPVVQVSPVEQGTNSGGSDSFIVISSTEQSLKDANVGVILAFPPEANGDSGHFHTNEGADQTVPIQPEINVGRADDNTDIQEGTQYQLKTSIGESMTTTDSLVGQTEPRIEMTGHQTETDQPADKQNQISDERAMRSAFASIASQSQRSGNRHAQINLNRHMDGDVDEPSISIELIDREPDQRVATEQAAVQRNRTVLIEVDDGFVSSDIFGHIDENQKFHVSRPTQEQGTPSTKAQRRGGSRQEDQSRTITIEQIQAAVNEKQSDDMRDDSSVERVKHNGRIQSTGTPSRNSDDQDDHSLEVNVRLLSKIKRIMRPELRKQPKRPRMEFFRHSEEQNDVSSELNDILTNPLFQQKIHEMDGRLQSAPEARGKRLMKKYAEALALTSSSSTPIINSFLPFLIACLLVCW